MFHQEMYVQGSDTVEQALYSDLVSVLQTFVEEIGEKSVESIQLNDAKLFVIKSDETKTYAVLRTDNDVNDKKMVKLLTSINQRFVKKFKKYINADAKIRGHILGVFKKDVNEILGRTMEKRMSNFFGSI